MVGQRLTETNKEKRLEACTRWRPSYTPTVAGGRVWVFSGILAGLVGFRRLCVFTLRFRRVAAPGQSPAIGHPLRQRAGPA